MKKLAVLSVILMLAAPGMALAQSGRDRDRDDDRPRAERNRDDDGPRRGKGKGQAQRTRDDNPGQNRGQGQNRNRGNDARTEVREGRRVPLRDVLPQINRRTPGRLLDSYPETGPGGRPQYRIRWQANSGERIDYIVDAETGAIIRRE
jgi:uncharacterized membrane protein YkoI